MIDFVSTRPGIDQNTRAAAQMVASIIAQMIRDASHRPTKDEAATHRNLNWDARAAIVYLFRPESPFETHIELLGGSAAPFRAALLSNRELQERGPFTPYQRRVIQARYHWWSADPDFVPEQPEEIEP